jgi:hypothetical protein
MERATYDDMFKDDYYRTLDELRATEGVTEEDIKEYQRTALIRKSIDEVKKRAKDLEEVRKSPARYSGVKSKVSRCIKVQNKVQRERTRSPSKTKAEAQSSRNNETMNGSISKISNLDVSQYGMSYS